VKQEVIQYIGPAGSVAPSDVKEEYRDDLEQDQLNKLGTTQENEDEEDEKFYENTSPNKEKKWRKKSGGTRISKEEAEVTITAPQWLLKDKLPFEEMENIGIYQYSESVLEDTDEKQLRLKNKNSIKTKTDKAILIKAKLTKDDRTREFWLPKSQIEIEE